MYNDLLLILPEEVISLGALVLMLVAAWAGDRSGKALTWLANRGYDPVYGARPLKQVIQRDLQNPLATMLLEGSIADGKPVDVTVRDGKLQIAGRVFAEEAA